MRSSTPWSPTSWRSGGTGRRRGADPGAAAGVKPGVAGALPRAVPGAAHRLLEALANVYQFGLDATATHPQERDGHGQPEAFGSRAARVDVELAGALGHLGPVRVPLHDHPRRPQPLE